MFDNAFRIVAWAMLSLVIVFTLSPVGLRPDFGHVNIERFVGFGVLALLFALAYPRRLAALAVIVLILAGLLEGLQLLVPGRDAAVANFLIKLAGGFLGLGVGGAITLALGLVRDRLRG